MVADSETLVLVGTIGAAVIGAIVTIITTVMNNASANRRQRREFQYHGKQSSVIGVPFIVTVILIVAVIYLATRSNDEPKVTGEAPAPAATVVSAPTATASAPPAVPTPTVAAATTAPSSAPACAAFTVQIAAPLTTDPAIPEFKAQAELLTESLPQLRELQSADSEACDATGRTQFYFGPFSNEDATEDACFAIGQTLRDKMTTFTAFRKGEGEIAYPFYRIVPGVPKTGSDGQLLYCDPANQASR